MKPWHETIPAPPHDNLVRVGNARDFTQFLAAGNKIATQLVKQISEFCKTKQPVTLDFGCGCGRVAIPMYYEHGLLTHACDIDESAISYLRKVLPQVDTLTSSFEPSLPYKDNTFDVVYSISIWTHLNEEYQLAWLREMQRILKPGGIFLPTTSSYKAIEHRKNTMKIPAWQDIAPDTLRASGILYRESATLHTHAEKYFPGVTDSYGQTSNDPAYLINHWSDLFVIRRHLINEVGNIQDLNVLINSK
jgi:ubiquinone/menaquinone biosynthesis C-methylase UbiE